MGGKHSSSIHFQVTIITEKVVVSAVNTMIATAACRYYALSDKLVRKLCLRFICHDGMENLHKNLSGGPLCVDFTSLQTGKIVCFLKS